jgi:DNA-binding transcriptional regulator YhcF (GntR family)
MTRQPAQGTEDSFKFAIDRHAEVPIGVQLTWALRARIRTGGLKAGERLPGLRDLAEATGVNVNTVKAVYQRLDREGLIDSQQGSGTFVAAMRHRPPDVAAIVANAARQARETGIDPREVAAALYVSSEPPRITDTEAERRRLLRTQIASLELALGEIEAEHPGVAPRDEARPGAGPTLLGAEELECVRTELVRRLATVQAAIDEQDQTDSEPPSAKPRRPTRRSGAKTPKTKHSTARPRATPRAAPASG